MSVQMEHSISSSVGAAEAALAAAGCDGTGSAVSTGAAEEDDDVGDDDDDDDDEEEEDELADGLRAVALKKRGTATPNCKAQFDRATVMSIVPPEHTRRNLSMMLSSLMCECGTAPASRS